MSFILNTGPNSSIRAMPTPPLDQKLVAAYADAFAEHPFLKQNGFAFLIDISGKIFKPKGVVALRDIEGNIEALHCTGFVPDLTHTLVTQHESSAQMVSCQAVESVMMVSVPPRNHFGYGLCG